MAKVNSQPYDSSDLSELMDNTGGWAKSWNDVIWYVENVAVYDSDFAKDEIQPIKEALEKVKKADKPFTTDYRNLYKKQIIRQAEKKDAPKHLVKILDQIKDKQYKNMGELLEGVGDVTWDHD